MSSGQGIRHHYIPASVSRHVLGQLGQLVLVLANQLGTGKPPSSLEDWIAGLPVLHQPTQCALAKVIALYTAEHSAHHGFSQQGHPPSAMLEIAKLLLFASLAIAAASRNNAS